MCSSVRIKQATQSQASGKNYHIDTETACGGVRRTLGRKAFFVVPTGWNHSPSWEKATSSILNHIPYWETRGKRHACHVTLTLSGNSEESNWTKSPEHLSDAGGELWREAHACCIAAHVCKGILSLAQVGSGKNTSHEANAIPTTISKEESSVSFTKPYCIASQSTKHSADVQENRAWRNRGTQSPCKVNCYNMLSLYDMSKDIKRLTHT